MLKNMIITIVFSILSNNLYSQIDCNPFHKVKNYTVEEENNYSISLVTCFHAQGVVVDLSYKNVMIGTHMMSKGHMNTVYGFVSYRYFIRKNTIVHMGPLYKINNDSGLLLCQFGLDQKLYGPVYLTSRILQINRELNYLNVGLKVSL
jgi:hypothetical protein